MNSRKNRKMKFAIKRTIVDLFQNTSIHGLKYTIERNSSFWERIFWAMTVCVMIISSFYLSVLHLRRFVENPMRSTIITFHGPVNLVPFPAVTICNSNLLLHSKINLFLKTLDIDTDEKDFLRKSIPQILGFFEIYEYTKLDLYKMEEIFEKLGYNDLVTVLRKIGPSCDEMLVQCRWNGEAMDCLNIFEETLTIDGICCSFNYYGSRFDFMPNYTTNTGWRSGLSVALNPLPQKEQYSTGKSTGVKVTIHNSMEYPGFERTFKTVSNGFYSFFQITAEKLMNTEEVQYLTKEQRKCVFSGEKTLTYHKSYHFSNCVAETHSRLLFEFCGCVPFYFTFSVSPKCSISQMECLQRYVKERRAIDPTDINCPARCENVIYKVLTSNVVMNNASIGLQDVHRRQDSSGIRIDVFFTGTHTLLSRDVLTSSLDLLSSIGGIYGLFMGCSIITIVELIYYSTLRFSVNLGWLERPRRIHKKRTNNPESEFRTGRTHRRHDVHRFEWNNGNSITFGSIG
ncbi:sodium channel protein Nach-like [Coccinella septempunctata]|uniref:sodium channel protein Nach-like n=1 Tax=Coccinella septempunctata TaxID=41139 RepID=UPI001D09352A|nr:sodium channel protein Nach-like [Coccinella septempunctata]